MELKELSADFTQNSKVKKLLEMTPIISNDDNENHIVVFTCLLDLAMSQGRWHGWCPQIS